MNYFLSKIIFLVAMLAPGESGWYPVEKKVKSDQVAHEEDDRSNGVLFLKEMEGERFQVKFPEAPTYTIKETGDIVISSTSDKGHFILTVSDRVELTSLTHVESFYEKLIHTEGYTYHLKAQNTNSALAEQFFVSFVCSES